VGKRAVEILKPQRVADPAEDAEKTQSFDSGQSPTALIVNPVRAVFLDRDGVVNKAVVREGKPYPPNSVEEMEIAPDAEEALTLLKKAGFALLVITNQPDVARSSQSREAVEAINRRLMAALPIDQIYVCYHDDRDGCECRKPLPGLILQAAREWQIDLGQQSFLIGDRWKDIEAGRRAGCTNILIEMHYAEKQAVEPDYRVNNLLEAAQLVVELTRKEVKQ
jgi:D-glycero-D-manno-heptose 1,7-bisphosphate phosphatase